MADNTLFDKYGLIMDSGKIIFKENEIGDKMYIIQEGNVRISREIGGKEHILAVLSKGDFFGEMALLFHQPRTASARAAEYCDLYYLDRSTFDRVLRRYPEFKKKVVAFAKQRSSRPHDVVAEGNASDV